MATIQNLQRVIGIKGTKANIEALSATLEEQAIALATESDGSKWFGIYSNGAWEWFRSGSGIGELLVDDAGNILFDDNNDVLYEDG